MKFFNKITLLILLFFVLILLLVIYSLLFNHETIEGMENKYQNMNFLYYLSAIGKPNMDKKLNILEHNLLYLHKNLNIKFDIMLNCYDDDISQIQDLLYSLDFINNIIIHKKKGRLVELWKTNPHHNLISNYDYILYIMDDIFIENLDIYEMISIKNKYNISFLSPKVVNSTHRYMNNKNDDVMAFTNMIEIYCLLFTKDDFQKFMDINDINNSHTWGIDLLLGYFKINSAIYYKFHVNHVLPSETNNEIAKKEMNSYLLKHGFSNKEEVIEKYPIFISFLKI